MRQTTYIRLKEDFINTYAEQLCKESDILIRNAKTVQKFINVLHHFMWYIQVKQFPDIIWVRKWFSKELPLINECGCYLDQTTHVENPKGESIVCFGNTNLSITITQPCTLAISLRDDSRVSICAFPACVVKVRTTDANRVTILHKGRFATIKTKVL